MAATHFLTGSYSSADEPGIKLWEFDEDTGHIVELMGVKGIERPSYIAIHPNGTSFVAASEVGDGGELVAYWIHAQSRKISEINRQKANGDHPAHVCIDEEGDWLLTCNYSGGNVNVYPLHMDGSIGDLADSVSHSGSGANSERQEAAHPHSIFQIPGTNLFLVSDLGTDHIYTYKLNSANGQLKIKDITESVSGTGPRHLAFHPSKPFVYSLGELNSTLTVYFVGQEEKLETYQIVNLLPEQFEGLNTAAEVAVSEDGAFLYASNRGHDSLAVFAIRENGLLQLVGHVPSGGKGPRHFALVSAQHWLIAANEQSNTLNLFRIGEDGLPHPENQPVHTKAPVCVKILR